MPNGQAVGAMLTGLPERPDSGGYRLASRKNLTKAQSTAHGRCVQCTGWTILGCGAALSPLVDRREARQNRPPRWTILLAGWERAKRRVREFAKPVVSLALGWKRPNT
ncbi:hypothetical protein KM043_010456 [Ampulex compressa]|nr:hypothetical protein KM043_010456 [Ampulex compressa]